MLPHIESKKKTSFTCKWLFRSLDKNPRTQVVTATTTPAKHNNCWSEERTQTSWNPAQDSEIMGSATQVNESQFTFIRTRKTSEGSRGSLCFLKVTLLICMFLTESSPVCLLVSKWVAWCTSAIAETCVSAGGTLAYSIKQSAALNKVCVFVSWKGNVNIYNSRSSVQVSLEIFIFYQRNSHK